MVEVEVEVEVEAEVEGEGSVDDGHKVKRKFCNDLTGWTGIVSPSRRRVGGRDKKRSGGKVSGGVRKNYEVKKTRVKERGKARERAAKKKMKGMQEEKEKIGKYEDEEEPTMTVADVLKDAGGRGGCRRSRSKVEAEGDGRGRGRSGSRWATNPVSRTAARQSTPSARAAPNTRRSGVPTGQNAHTVGARGVLARGNAKQLDSGALDEAQSKFVGGGTACGLKPERPYWIPLLAGAPKILKSLVPPLGGGGRP
ncbi:hypothetical protein DFH06DRAFT_1149656 [Mycena polygramma]|nr:hypothetical protein DFH06DRAFT_1149656 [Mycena polygramma]